MSTYSQSTSFHGGHDAGASISEFLSHKAAGEHIQLQTTDLLRNVPVEEAQTPSFLHNFLGKLSGFIVMRGDWDDFFTSELPSQLLHFLLFIGDSVARSLSGITSLGHILGLQRLVHGLKSVKTQ